MEADRERRLEELYGRYAREVRIYALRRMDAGAADDVVAETFVVAWRRLEHVPESALPWLYGVARRLIANQLREAARRRALLARLTQARSATEAGSRQPRLTYALARLRARDREALLLVAWEGLSTAEMAIALGCSPQAARARLHRARRRLRSLLDEDECIIHQTTLRGELQ